MAADAAFTGDYFMTDNAMQESRWTRIKGGIYENLLVFLYLYVWLAAILLYRMAVLHAEGIEFTPYGIAVVKASILSKFMLMAEALHVEKWLQRQRLVVVVLLKSLAFLAVLVALSYVEAGIRGMLNDETFEQAMSRVAGGVWEQVVATSLLIWLILLPYLAFREIDKVLGQGTMRSILFAKRG